MGYRWPIPGEKQSCRRLGGGGAVTDAGTGGHAWDMQARRWR
jgi:hypothetical protein